MEQLFTNLSHAVEGAPLIALTASFIWGILSIILSPCHLASIPLIVGFISEQGQVTTRRAFWTATLFSVGILITIAAIGVITAAAGRMMGDVGRYGNYFVAIIFFMVGLHLVGVIPLSTSPVRAGGHEAQRLAGGVHPGSGVRHRPGSLHLCLHGADAGGDVQAGAAKRRFTARRSCWPMASVIAG
jgi:cytochrome c biogenesis protein CcdA